ncbi:fatty acid-binding protein, intestinal-like [Acanthaster planci]|uniref:Fatty acid-binding protein, intestinal-like n=1 Tax=Acanthaster planci TaxID=133434 RepID=A0A8B7Y769_ACAPL|nr:fatty acid-binding protein, intestinal-like [Acanthaster planci]
MPANFSGTWKSFKSENWANLLDKMGVPKEKLPADLQVTHTISQSGNTINMKTTNNHNSDVKNVTINVGSNHKEDVMGHQIEQTTAWQGNKLVMRAVNGSGGVIYEIVGDQMVVTIEHQGVVAKSYFSK